MNWKVRRIISCIVNQYKRETIPFRLRVYHIVNWFRSVSEPHPIERNYDPNSQSTKIWWRRLCWMYSHLCRLWLDIKWKENSAKVNWQRWEKIWCWKKGKQVSKKSTVYEAKGKKQTEKWVACILNIMNWIAGEYMFMFSSQYKICTIVAPFTLWINVIQLLYLWI